MIIAETRARQIYVFLMAVTHCTLPCCGRDGVASGMVLRGHATRRHGGGGGGGE
jgi:hypothetical protein